MIEKRNPLRWILFWIFWVLATLAGLVVDRLVFRGFGAVGMVDQLKTWIAAGGGQLKVYEVAAAAALGVVDGLILGAFQWLPLRRRVAKAGFWILATALGMGAALALFWWILDPVTGLLWPRGGSIQSIFWLGLVDRGLSGTFLGVSQWVVLRAGRRRSGWWILAMALSMVGAWCLRWFVNSGAAFLFLGAASGVVLVFLLAGTSEEAKPEREPPVEEQGVHWRAEEGK
jgi:hypothetical protein